MPVVRGDRGGLDEDDVKSVLRDMWALDTLWAAIRREAMVPSEF